MRRAGNRSECKKQILLHPVVHTFIILKYSSLLPLLLVSFLLKIAFVAFLTGLAISNKNFADSWCANLTDNSRQAIHFNRKFSKEKFKW